MNDSEKPIQPLWFRYLRALSVMVIVFGGGLSLLCLALAGLFFFGVAGMHREPDVTLPMLPGAAFFLFVTLCCWWPLHSWLRERRAQYRD